MQETNGDHTTGEEKKSRKWKPRLRGTETKETLLLLDRLSRKESYSSEENRRLAYRLGITAWIPRAHIYLPKQIKFADFGLSTMVGCDECEIWNCGAKLNYNLVANKFVPQSEIDWFWLLSRTVNNVLSGKRVRNECLEGKPAIVVLNDMGDTFTPSMPLMWFEKTMRRLEEVDLGAKYIISTKWPERAERFFANYGKFPDDLILMTSASHQGFLDRRTEALLKVKDMYPESRVGLMLMPILEHIEMSSLSWLDWIVLGAHTGTKKAAGGFPSERWFDDVIDYTRKDGVPIFVNNLWRHRSVVRKSTAEMLSDTKRWRQEAARFKIREFPEKWIQQ